MSFIEYLNPNDWKSDWTNNEVCNCTWSRDQMHVNNQSIKQFMLEHLSYRNHRGRPLEYMYIG